MMDPNIGRRACEIGFIGWSDVAQVRSHLRTDRPVRRSDPPRIVHGSVAWEAKGPAVVVQRAEPLRLHLPQNLPIFPNRRHGRHLNLTGLAESVDARRARSLR